MGLLGLGHFSGPISTKMDADLAVCLSNANAVASESDGRAGPDYNGRVVPRLNELSSTKNSQ